MTTELLGLDEITSSQAQKEVTHNTALRQIEGRMVRAKDKDLTTPPGSPANGDTYIIPSGATGVWASKTNQIAHFYGGAWSYWAPIEGVRLWLMDEDMEYVYNGTSWIVLAGAGLAVYVHTQASPALTWTVNHNLGYRPTVEVLDVGGAEVDADVLHTSVNQSLLSFTVALAGTARCV